jgi:hypothetical protein
MFEFELDIGVECWGSFVTPHRFVPHPNMRWDDGMNAVSVGGTYFLPQTGGTETDFAGGIMWM